MHPAVADRDNHTAAVTDMLQRQRKTANAVAVLANTAAVLTDTAAVLTNSAAVLTHARTTSSYRP